MSVKHLEISEGERLPSGNGIFSFTAVLRNRLYWIVWIVIIKTFDSFGKENRVVRLFEALGVLSDLT